MGQAWFRPGRQDCWLICVAVANDSHTDNVAAHQTDKTRTRKALGSVSAPGTMCSVAQSPLSERDDISAFFLPVISQAAHIPLLDDSKEDP